MGDAITPFVLDVPQDRLDDLARRIDMTRWPEKETVADWTQGVPLTALREVMDYWRHEYRWRDCQDWLNRTGQFVTTIDGLPIHFLHVRSPEPGAAPLILTHGWPGSVMEFREVIGPLSNPRTHGGRAEDAFHLVIPSLPGFGFSGKPAGIGWGVERIARAWGTLMERLGYARWFAQGGDWGSAVTTAIGAMQAPGCAGVHLNMPIARPEAEDLAAPGPDEQRALAALQFYQEWDSGYSTQQRTRPQTIGYALVDSPVGLAAWIYEKMRAWTDNAGRAEDAVSRDAILDNIMLYWLPATGASSARLYWESFGSFAPVRIELPVAVSAFPKEIIPSARKWCERVFPNLVHWGDMPRGGHFAAWEQPDDFVSEVRKAFAAMR